MTDFVNGPLQNTNYDPKTLIPNLGMEQLVPKAQFTGSYSVDERCLEKVRHIFLGFKVSRYIEGYSFLSIRGP